MNGAALAALLRPVLSPFGEARPLPREVFVDPDVLELEERALFARAWVPVAHEADVARPGEWVSAPLRGEHLVVLRGADLELRALHALCIHRAVPLCEGAQGQAPGLSLRCPYHGWTFGTDGTLLEAPGAPPAGARALPASPLAVRAGVVFVNLDGQAAPLTESWDGGPPWLSSPPLGPLARARRTDHEVKANWKVVVGNFQESHHFPTVHPTLEGRTPWRRSSSVVASGAWLGGRMELEGGCETVSRSGERRGRPFVAAEEDRRRVHDAYVFPLWLTSLQPDYLLTYRLAPLAVDATLVVAEVHVHPRALASGADLEDVFAFWDVTNAEDRAICERQQRGLSSRRAASCYATSEDGLHAFERLVASRLLEALGAEGSA